MVDRHEHSYPVNVKLMSNEDNPPILAFECGICHERMEYNIFYLQKGSEKTKPVLRMSCENMHWTVVELNFNE